MSKFKGLHLAASHVPVLDYGYLDFVESWGSDERIVEAARMSTDKGFVGWGPHQTFTCPLHGVVGSEHVCRQSSEELGMEWVHMNCSAPGVGTACDVDERPGDEKLLRYLWENKHATPFEMAGLIIEVQAPIFVFRELSARYTPLPDVNYVPTVERLMMNARTPNKQAGTVKDAEVLTEHSAAWFRDELIESYKRAEELYQRALLRGVPKELARVHLPVGRYSRMRASANLRNWLGFMTLCSAPNAQWEIRQYSNALGDLVAKTFPRTWALFSEGK
jgi:thymidylate synthase (FAD)